MQVLGIDPGHTQSAVMLMQGDRIEFKGIFPNDHVRDLLDGNLPADVLLVEKVASYGMPVGSEVFETVFWSGRFVEAWLNRFGDVRVERMTRNEIKMALCHRTAKVSDSVIRQRLIDLYGPGKDRAIGTKKSQGPLYGVKADEWAALALVRAWMEVQTRAARLDPERKAVT